MDRFNLGGCIVSALFLFLAFLPGRRHVFHANVENVLGGLLSEERSHLTCGGSGAGSRGGGRVAVGLGSCLDGIVDGLELLGELGVSPPSEPVHHNVVSSNVEMAEVFAYFFEYGAASE